MELLRGTMPRVRIIVTILGLAVTSVVFAQEATPDSSNYLVPPQTIVEIVDAPPPPGAIVSPNRKTVAFIERRGAPPIQWLARPMHRLAGYRIDPRNSGPWNAPAIQSIDLQSIRDNNTRFALSPQTKILAPRGTSLGWPRFSPDGTHLSYAVIRDTGIELWVVDLSTGQPRPLTSASLNATLGNPCEWLGDSSGVLCRFRMSARGAPPDKPGTPSGPNIQANDGQLSTVRTYQDLLSNAHDKALFEYHFTSQVATVALATGRRTAIGDPGLYARVSGSPNSEYLLVERLTKPWSLLVPASRFSRSIEVWTHAGETQTFASRPIADTVPIGGVPRGPRQHHWHPIAPATVIWVEAQDEGNPSNTVDHRDIILSREAPFIEDSQEIARTEFRFSDIAWTQDGTALITERDRATRWTRTHVLYPGGRDLRLLFDRSTETQYRNPGRPLRQTVSGVSSHTIRQDTDAIYLTGNGASIDGDRPFIDRLDLTTLETERIFHTEIGTYETIVGVLSVDGTVLLTRRESPTEPPNYFLRNLTTNDVTALTEYTDPAPVLRNVNKRLITYEREDGVQLSAVLYLPPEYDETAPVPLLMWAYPREFTTTTAASEVRGSPYRFTTPRGASHLFLLTEGYAILDGPAMPIIGEGETANDSYVEQLVSSAQAAVKTVIDMGITQADRIAIGGHSYGAFMTANLLAHSDLFRAGIARSGAYNRTLTPFGFQNERRTFWEAPEVYGAMSPFFHADHVNEPILLIHGEIDNNSGTFPIQSERYYHALQGHGATVCYASLPYESHSYTARESILHVVAEMLHWCNTHLASATP